MEKKIDRRKTNGGARQGAGRKYKGRRLMHLNIENSLAKLLKGMPNMSDTVNEALRDYFYH